MDDAKKIPSACWYSSVKTSRGRDPVDSQRPARRVTSRVRSVETLSEAACRGVGRTRDWTHARRAITHPCDLCVAYFGSTQRRVLIGGEPESERGVSGGIRADSRHARGLASPVNIVAIVGDAIRAQTRPTSGLFRRPTQL
jgi:hypothetical protein